jgi:zinc and cadmium transporter
VLVSYPFITNIERLTLGARLAFSAGALVYVGASNLPLAVERENKSTRSHLQVQAFSLNS